MGETNAYHFSLKGKQKFLTLSDDDKKNIRADICARKAAKLVVEKAK